METCTTTSEPELMSAWFAASTPSPEESLTVWRRTPDFPRRLPTGITFDVVLAAPWLTGPASVLAGAADFVSLPRMTEALTDATDTEWEEARSSVAAFFLQLPVFSRAVAAMTGNRNFAGMGGHTALDSEPLMAVLLMAFVLGACGADWFGNVEDLAASLARWPTLVGEMKQVLDLPQPELDRNLAGLGHEMRARTQRVIQALLDGELDTGPKPVR
ncbi:hypothetical protein [Streptomyces sp. NPDC102283]|uniref:hypothetical protein n=1 Tax=Streptomyces sp. NPDC102283 TaxID=3366155 RepID=UPI00381D833F